MSSFTGKILLVVVSTVFSLLAAEIAISIIRPQDLSGSWRVETETGLLANKSHGSSRHQFGARVVNYKFVAPHLRGPVGSGAIKVLVLGDSFTFGWLLTDEDHYVSLLQRKINSVFYPGNIALLNAAAGGWGTGDYVAFVEDFGDNIRPDIILVFLNADDIGRVTRSQLWKFDETSGVLSRSIPSKDRLKIIMNSLPGYQWLLEHSHLTQLIRSIVLGSASPHQADSIDVFSLRGNTDSLPRFHSDSTAIRVANAQGAALFRRLQRWCKERHVYLAVTTTGWHRTPYVPSEPTSSFMIGADGLFNELGIPFSDTSSQVSQFRDGSGNRFVIPGDSHPNEEGAKLIAEHVFPFVNSQLVRYCRLANRCCMPH